MRPRAFKLMWTSERLNSKDDKTCNMGEWVEAWVILRQEKDDCPRHLVG